MAINPNVSYPGRVTAPGADYPYGSSKNESTPGAGDGTPYEIARANDIFGFQQALLKLAGIVPSGNAETSLISEYLQAIVEVAAGRAVSYDDIGAADLYVANLKTNQQGVASYFDGMTVELLIVNDNTGPSQIDVKGTSGILLGLKDIKTAAGLDPEAGVITGRMILRYDGVNGWFEIVEFGGGGQLLGTAAVKAIAYNAQNVSEDITIEAAMNAISAGPITIDTGKTVTIETGARWVIS